MLPNPLHPAVVHFPMAFAVLLPISAVLAMWAIQRGTKPLRAWAVPVALALALTASSWVALETGEAQEDRVEAIVGEAPLHAHEEAAERFLVISGIVLLVTATGLMGGTVGAAARLVGTAGTIVVLAAGIQVGAAGGELVYKYGAAQAYVDGATATSAVQPGELSEREEH